MVESFSVQELKILKDKFSAFDKKGDGRMSSAEIGALMNSLGYDMSKAQLQILLYLIDNDDTGTIEFNEFVQTMALEKQGKFVEVITKRTFSLFDGNNSGKISASEIRNVLANWGMKLSYEEIDREIRRVDINGDGMLSYKEFELMLSTI